MISNVGIVKHKLSSELKEIEILPLGDLHIGDGNTNLTKFFDFIRYVSESKKTYVILNGDLMNNALKTSVSNVYNETMSPALQKRFLVQTLRDIKDKILLVNTGNHEQRTTKDADVDLTKDICIELDIEHLYCGEGGVLHLNFGTSAKLKQNMLYTLYVTHGSGGGSKLGAPLSRINDYGGSFEGIDIFIMGHTHKMTSGIDSKLCYDARHNKLIQKNVGYVTANAWQKYAGYAQRMMLKPSANGATRILLNGTTKNFRLIQEG
jgi:predicted phosphodiesterase